MNLPATHVCSIQPVSESLLARTNVEGNLEARGYEYLIVGDAELVRHSQQKDTLQPYAYIIVPGLPVLHLRPQVFFANSTHAHCTTSSYHHPTPPSRRTRTHKQISNNSAHTSCPIGQQQSYISLAGHPRSCFRSAIIHNFQEEAGLR